MLVLWSEHFSCRDGEGRKMGLQTIPALQAKSHPIGVTDSLLGSGVQNEQSSSMIARTIDPFKIKQSMNQGRAVVFQPR